MFKKIFSLLLLLSFSIHGQSLLDRFKAKVFGNTSVEKSESSDTSEPAPSQKICRVCQPKNNGNISLDEKTLRRNLKEESFGHFDEKAKVSQRLAQHDLHPSGVVNCLEELLYDYEEYLQNPLMTKIMIMRKPQLLKLILDGCPEALEQLKKQPLYHQLGWFEEEEDNARG